MGNFIGILIEDKLAMGVLILRVFVTTSDACFKERLYEAGFGVTVINAQGRNGAVEILFSVIKRKDQKKAVAIIESCQSDAFYSIEEAKSVNKGIFPTDRRRLFAKTKRKHVGHGK
jgi:uncharacterized protein YebE (UPF0316 family)